MAVRGCGLPGNGPGADLHNLWHRVPRARLDLFLPDRTPRGLVVFVHGGFWLAFDKSFWSHLAAGLVDGPIRLSGHSAGGHLAARQLGKLPVLAGVCIGFIANRIMSAYRREAEYMLEDGALPWDIDTAMEDYGFPMGLFRMQDLAGLDISWAMRLLDEGIARSPDGIDVVMVNAFGFPRWRGGPIYNPS